jgi:hypothetical protein
MTDLPTVRALLSFVFHAAEGDMTLTVDGQEPYYASTASDVAGFVNDAAIAEKQPVLDLITGQSVASAVAFHFDDYDAAGSFVERFGPPMLALSKVEEADDILIYGLSREVPGDYFDAVSEFHPNVIESIPLDYAWAFTEQSEMALSTGELSGILDPNDFISDTDDEVQVEVSETWKLQDATVYGEIDPDLMERDIVLGLGMNREAKRWKPTPMKLGQFITQLATHTESKDKDGKAFIQGPSVDGARTALAMKELYVVGLDVDSGVTFDRAMERIKSLGVFASIATTHSHLSTVTEIGEGAWRKWARRVDVEDYAITDQLVQRYLSEERGVDQANAKTATFAGKEQSVKGIQIIAHHAPRHKYRIIMPLSRPYIIKDEGKSQKDAIDGWKGRILTLEQMLGFAIDHACLDPSRLYYLPRHAPGREFMSVILTGKPLDFHALAITDPKEVTRDAFTAAGSALGGNEGTGPIIAGATNLKGWAASHAPGWQIAQVFRDHCPERIRDEQTSSKFTVDCPFDGGHSNPGDPEDKGTYVQDAHADGGDGGFVFSCRHNSCQRHDRLEFLCEAINSGWIPEDALLDETYMAFEVGIEKPEPTQETKDETIFGQAKAFRSDVKTETVKKLFEDAIAEGMETLELGRLVDAVCASTGFAKAQVNQVMKSAVADAKKKTKRNGSRAESINARAQASGSTMIHKVLEPSFGYAEQTLFYSEVLSRENEKRPSLLQYGGVLHFCDPMEDGKLSFGTARWTHLSTYLNQFVTVHKVSEDGDTTAGIDRRILEELIDSTAWNQPSLEGFASLPFYTQSGRLVTDIGYDAESKVYLKPLPGFTLPDVSATPSDDEVDAALAHLNVVFGDFPFSDGLEGDDLGHSSKAHLLSMLMQPFIRTLIDGPCPIYFVNKPAPGTGATKMLTAALMITGDSTPAGQTEKSTDEETRKTITAAFKGSKTTLWFDNMNKKIASSAFCNLATSAAWEDRELGSSTTLSFPNRMLFIISGNNLSATHEILRRTVNIRLDVKGDPEARTPKDFAIEHLEIYVRENMSALVGCVLTLINNWIAQGRPAWSGERPLVSFESWSSITGGILEANGIGGFLENRHLSEAVPDEETEAWQSLLTDVVDRLGIAKFHTIQDIMTRVVDNMVTKPIGIPNVRWTLDDSGYIGSQLERRILAKIGAPFKIIHDGERKTLTIGRETLPDGKTKAYAVVEFKKRAAAA